MSSIFGELFGGVLKNIDAEEVFAHVATNAAASVAKKPLSACFQKMKVEGRRTLAGKARSFADKLEAGQCDEAAAVAADVIDDIKLR